MILKNHFETAPFLHFQQKNLAKSWSFLYSKQEILQNDT